MLSGFVNRERHSGEVYPPESCVFRALALTPPERVKVLIVGQDPYHEPGQAHGLAFSVPDGVKLPPSLRNIYRELAADTGITPPVSGDLSCWAEQGVLLLNSILTVRAGAAGSHRNKGWETLTDAVLQTVNANAKPSVFILWGNFAISKQNYIDTSRHRVITSPHPSPLSAFGGFFGSRPFSRCNEYLLQLGRTPVNWGGTVRPAAE